MEPSRKSHAIELSSFLWRNDPFMYAKLFSDWFSRVVSVWGQISPFLVPTVGLIITTVVLPYNGYITNNLIV